MVKICNLISKMLKYKIAVLLKVEIMVVSNLGLTEPFQGSLSMGLIRKDPLYLLNWKPLVSPFLY